jgi:hypothetical protein
MEVAAQEFIAAKVLSMAKIQAQRAAEVATGEAAHHEMHGGQFPHAHLKHEAMGRRRDAVEIEAERKRQ